MATDSNDAHQARLKLRAAQRALQFVKPGMTVGLGLWVNCDALDQASWRRSA
jgi:hypothetical protein